MTRYYTAARFSRLDEMLGVRDVLTALGHTVTSRWIDGGHQAEPGDTDAMRRFAREDFADIERCDVLLAFTETPREPHTNRGGRHVELGIALARPHILTVVVGPLENAFTTLADEHYPDWSRFVGSISEESIRKMSNHS